MQKYYKTKYDMQKTTLTEHDIILMWLPAPSI